VLEFSTVAVRTFQKLKATLIYYLTFLEVRSRKYTKKAALCLGAQEENLILAFTTLSEDVHIPWCVAPSSKFKASNIASSYLQLLFLSLHSFPLALILLSQSHKDL
jgi:hypothetical protein